MATADTTTHMHTVMEKSHIDFVTQPAQYKHWKLTIDERVATLALDVQEQATLAYGYELKLNSYDLWVDIELYDATQRLRFEHPEVAVVVLTSAKPRVFCAGANIKMLGLSSHSHKVNFCKFTNETRNSIEDATAHSAQVYVCAINGTAAGGGYELALACAYILLIDDGSSTISLPELPLLAVLPGTGGLTRLVDKRQVRPDHADFFCTTAEGMRGKRAVDWRLVDELVPRSQFDAVVKQRAQEFVARSDRPSDATGITLTPLVRTFESDRLVYEHVTIDIDRDLGTAAFLIHGPQDALPQHPVAIHAAGVSFWPLALARELDDAMLHLRLNEEAIGTWVLRTIGDHELVQTVDTVLSTHADDWLVREIGLYLKRTLQRLDVSSRSLIALIEPGSCCTGTLLEFALAADRSYMLDGTFADSTLPPATIRLSQRNFGPLPMVNGLTRLARRFLAEPERVASLQERIGQNLGAAEAEALGLVTFIPDDIDWQDEVRLALEERASFSPDALTGLEASLRFAGPETLHSKIFGRLSAWQNWIFQRPNAVGDDGALTLYGTGKKSLFDKRRA
jgi:benzoyl-CoA-dihydrodiol lyase